ncbi:putative atp binding protein [Sesbania bispinosa]|nr:putative atp binding protein [Sesbania bispinosa]
MRKGGCWARPTKRQWRGGVATGSGCEIEGDNGHNDGLGTVAAKMGWKEYTLVE